MKDYISTFPLHIHVLMILYLMINQTNHKFLKHRINPTFESPINWQLKPASAFQRILYTYENLILILILFCGIMLGVKYKWFFAIFFLLEVFTVSALIFGLFRGLLFRLNPDGYYFFRFQSLINKTRIISFLIDIYLFYSLIKIIFH
ncbi:hypothetical protein ABID46_002512 [Moheibacter stercoris]|uniref:Uncharacterized protein n=1 Tax=Moheibacter stercoris TaxID=1628251 RepID=A0ABV2LWI9_9FLAO